MASKIEGRAETTEEKRALVERLYVAWLKCPELRLGQFLDNALIGMKPHLFYLEDEPLISAAEKFAKKWHR